MSTLPSVIVGLVYHIPFADAFFGSVVAGTFHDPFHRPLCIVLSRGGGRGSAAMANVQRSVVGALLLALLLLFLVRRLASPARTVVLLRTEPQAMPLSDPSDPPPTVRARPLPSLPLQSALTPSPPPPPPCTKLECTTKLKTLEPDWVQLSSQPRIDWQGGGVRGDCLVGEYDYMMKSPYCTPPGTPTPTSKKWPSPERLEAADVHSKHLLQCRTVKVPSRARSRPRGRPPLQEPNPFAQAQGCPPGPRLEPSPLESPREAALWLALRCSAQPSPMPPAF